MFWVGMLSGLFVGGFFGIMIMCLLIIGKTEDERNEN